MKTVIRTGVFETNSSSTHSVVLKTLGEGEKFREEKDLPSGVYEVRSDWEKLLLVLGGIDCLAFENNWQLAHDGIIPDLKNDVITADFDFSKIDGELSMADELNAARSVFIKEYCRRHGEDADACVKKINGCRHEPCDEFMCADFFHEDVLSECCCSMSNCVHITELFGLESGKISEETLLKAADVLFDPKSYFVLEEGWYGGDWNDRKPSIY